MKSWTAERRSPPSGWLRNAAIRGALGSPAAWLERGSVAILHTHELLEAGGVPRQQGMCSVEYPRVVGDSGRDGHPCLDGGGM